MYATIKAKLVWPKRFSHGRNKSLTTEPGTRSSREAPLVGIHGKNWQIAAC